MFQFCYHCGAPLSKASEPQPSISFCVTCGDLLYFGPKVAVCALLEKERRIVLLRRATEPSKGKWCLPGGLMEKNEEPMDTLLREIFEEIGCHAIIDQLVGIHIDYNVNQDSLVILYSASVKGCDFKTSEEISEFQLFLPEEIPWETLAFPSTREVVANWVSKSSQKNMIGTP